MPVLMIAKFSGDPIKLAHAYDQASGDLERHTGSALPPGAIRHTCAVGGDALYVVDIWESAEALSAMIESEQFEDLLTGAGFPSPREADIKVLELHAAVPPL